MWRYKCQHGPIGSYTEYDTPTRFKREQFIPVSYTHSFATPHLGHAELPHQVLSEGIVMTDVGFVFPADMSPQDMDRRKQSMMLTGSVFTKFEPIYELGDGTPVFTFLVKPTEPSPAAGGITSVDAQVLPEGIVMTDDVRSRVRSSSSQVPITCTARVACA